MFIYDRSGEVIAEVERMESVYRYTAFNFCDECLIDADLRGVNLSGSDFSGADLSGADLSRCKLYDCDFDKTKISNTEFELSKVDGSCFSEASMVSSFFDNASLTGVNFINCSIHDSSFHYAKLSEARFYLCELVQIDFSCAYCFDTSFKESTYRALNFKDAVELDIVRFGSHTELNKKRILSQLREANVILGESLEGVIGSVSRRWSHRLNDEF